MEKLAASPQALDKIFKRIKQVLAENNDEYDLIPLRLLVQRFRVKTEDGEDPNAVLNELLEYFKKNHSCLIAFKEYLDKIFKERSFKSTLLDLGILVNSDFRYELRKRLVFKILPYQPDPRSMEYVFNNIFFYESDSEWISKIKMERLEEVFRFLEVKPLEHGEKKSKAFSDFLFAINVLCMRISGGAMEAEVLQMAPEYEGLDSPFIALQKETAAFIECVDEQSLEPDEGDLKYKQILVLIEQCHRFIATAYKNVEKYGISIRVNQTLIRLRQQLDRLEMLLGVVVHQQSKTKERDTIELMLKLISLNAQKNNVRGLILDATKSIAFEITSYTGKTGEKYITSTVSEYIRMLLSAMGCGVVVAFLCLIKLLLSHVDTSAFGQAAFYSLNYSLGFIAIYLLRFTLATKQPAMTASTLAQTLSEDMKQKEKYENFSNLFARLSRSQFIAFVGNCALAFPVVILLAYGMTEFYGANPTELRWEQYLEQLHPLGSLSILYAALTGFYLFLSGIIAGNYNNKIKHYKISRRIQNHPLLLTTIGPAMAKRIAKFYEKNGAGIVSNFWFGVFLGTTASVGYFIGIPLDIRHIAFSAGNLALGLFGAQYESTGGFSLESFPIAGGQVAILALSVVLIGMMNFLVSFGFSLALALRSREIPFTEALKIFKGILLKFIKSPFEFFIPPFWRKLSSSEKKEEDEIEEELEKRKPKTPRSAQMNKRKEARQS